MAKVMINLIHGQGIMALTFNITIFGVVYMMNNQKSYAYSTNIKDDYKDNYKDNFKKLRLLSIKNNYCSSNSIYIDNSFKARAERMFISIICSTRIGKDIYDVIRCLLFTKWCRPYIILMVILTIINCLIK